MKIKFSNIVKLFFISSVIGVGISYSKLYFFHIMLIILIFFYLYKNNYVLKIKKLQTNYHYFFYFMLFWYAISMIWSSNKIYSLRYLAYIIFGVSIILVMIYYCDNLEKQIEIFNIFKIIFVFEIILCILEALQLFRWPISPYSFSLKFFRREMKVDLNWSSNILNEIFSTPTGFHWNPNNLATAMVIIFPFFILDKNIFVKLLGSFSIFFIIYKTNSRTNLFAFIIQILSYFIFISKKKYLYIIFFIFLILIIVLNINFVIDFAKNSSNKFLIKILDFSDLIKNYLDYSNINFSDTSSVSIRKILILNGLEALKKSCFLGVGAGNSEYIQELKGGVGSRNITSMHFFWFELLVDGGIVFFIFLLIWYFKILLKLYFIYNSSANYILKYFSSSTFISLIGFFIGCISASSVIYFFPMWILYGFSIVTINNYMMYKKYQFLKI